MQALLFPNKKFLPTQGEVVVLLDNKGVLPQATKQRKGDYMSMLASYFLEALRNIEPEDDKLNAADAHKEVSKALIADQNLKNLGISPVLIGSYKRSVSIRRVKDVDVFARLYEPGENLSPGKVLDLFESVLSSEQNFGRSRVQRQDRSIKVDFPDYQLAVDVVPARPYGDHWEIPNKPEDAERAQWIETNPLRLNSLTEDANKAYLLNDDGIYVPIVKLVRQVRRTWVKDHPGGLFFEIMTYWAFQNESPSANSTAEYLALILERIARMMPVIAENGLDDPTIPGNKISTKATESDFEKATAQIEAAAELAHDSFMDEDDCRSAMKWRTLLGKTTEDEDVFPLPSYCNPDGSTQKLTTVTRGATRVPGGNDRYA